MKTLRDNIGTVILILFVLAIGFFTAVGVLLFEFGTPIIQKAITTIGNCIFWTGAAMTIAILLMVLSKIVLTESGIGSKLIRLLNRCPYCCRPVVWTEDKSDIRRCECGRYPDMF